MNTSKGIKMTTKLKHLLQTAPQLSCASSALILLRFIAGAAFVIHGWGKMQNPMAWMGAEAPVPGIFQFLAAFSEFGGGIAWILGFLTPIAAMGIGCTMTVAVLMHMFVMKDPFVNPTGGGSYELALVYWGISILIGMMGPGKFSVDAKVFGERT
jgi:putative oxidoreductase